MRLPSIKTLDTAFPGKGKALRILLESVEAVENHPAVITWVDQCYNMPSMREKRMCALDAEAETFGVEYVPAGSNLRSPGFWYLNAGDTYAPTICRSTTGAYRVASWGDIVERGNYS